MKTINSNKGTALLQRRSALRPPNLRRLWADGNRAACGLISILGSEAGLKIESFKDGNRARTYRLKRPRRIKVKG